LIRLLKNKSFNPDSPGQIAWRKFKKDKLAMAGLFYICLVALVAILGPFVRPDHTPDANDQHLVISKQQPGFTVEMLAVKLNQPPLEYSLWEKITHGGWPSDFRLIPTDSIWFRGDSVWVEQFSSYDLPESQEVKMSFHLADVTHKMDSVRSEGEKMIIYKDGISISKTRKELIESVKENNIETHRFLLGTDKYGRDLLSRLMAGAVISLSVGVIAVLISLLIGLTLGAVAGYFRGWIDEVIMWFINVVWSIPTLLLVMAITIAFGKGFWKVFLAVGLTMWVEVARVVRGQVMSIREKEYVEAGKALGFSDRRIIFKHILPNVMSAIIVISAANFAAAILVEAGLSFLGIGAQIPTPSWGNMIKEHYSFITTDLAYLAILPGVLIMSLVLAFMLVGNGLRDALDSRA
jgi:peptide/nickel transport system permease protein